MKTFKDILSEVAQPAGGDEAEFKAKHKIMLFKHPVAHETQFSGEIQNTVNEALATDYSSYEEYAAARNKKGLQVIPKKLWNDLKSDLKEATSMDGDTIKVGSGVGFKDGYEQYGTVTKISGNTVTVRMFDSDTGEKYEIKKEARKLWLEEDAFNEAIEKDIDPNAKIVVTGVKGMKSKPFTKKFRNMKAFDKWAESEVADDYQIQYVMNESLEEAFSVGDKVTYQMNKKERGNAVVSRKSTAKKDHYYLKTEKEGTIMVPTGELELKESAVKRAMKRLGGDLEESKMPYAVIDTADNNKVVAMASDEKGAKRSIATSELPPMSIEDKTTLKVVKTSKKQSIGQPLKETAGSFITKAAAAKNKNKKKFEIGDKEYPVTIKQKSADKVLDESVELNEKFSAGRMELRDGSEVKISAQDAKLLNQMLNDLNPKNKKEMMKVATSDSAGFEEIVGFAREAL